MSKCLVFTDSDGHMWVEYRGGKSPEHDSNAFNVMVSLANAMLQQRRDPEEIVETLREITQPAPPAARPPDPPTREQP